MEREDGNEENSVSDQIKHALSGGLSGAFTRALCQPLDVLKIRFQLQTECENTGAKYHSIWQACRVMHREEGTRVFWRGHNPAQVLSIVYGISQFWFYEEINHALKRAKYLERHEDFRHFVCGAAAGSFATVCIAPIDVVRTRLIAQDHKGGYRNTFQGLRAIFKQESMAGLFRGLGPSLLQIAPMSGSQFMFYNLFGNALKGFFNLEPSAQLPAWELLFVGGSAGVCAKVLVYPLDLAKKRLQIQGFAQHRKTFGKHFICKGLWDCIRVTMREEGWIALYKGLNPTILKSGATTALHFVFYDEIVRYLSDPSHQW